MKLLEAINKKEYNDFVAAQESGSFLQSWEWGEWQETLGHRILRYWISDDSGNRVASVQLIKMSLPFYKYYLYAPYGPVGDLRLEIEHLRLALRHTFPKAIFVRIEPLKLIEGLGPSLIKSVNIQPAISIVLEVGRVDEDLLAGMHNKTRYNIRLAERHGVEIQSELAVTPGHGLYAQEAVNLILETQGRQKYRGHSRNYYQKLLDFFALHNTQGDLKLVIYKALYKKQLLASAVMVDFGKTRTYLYGGSSESFRNIMAPYLLHWRAILDARDKGLQYYDFGGSEVSSGGERGFTRFKQGFGGKVVEYAGAYDIINNSVAYKFYQLGRKANRLFR